MKAALERRPGCYDQVTLSTYFWMGLKKVSRDKARKPGARKCEMRFEPEPTDSVS